VSKLEKVLGMDIVFIDERYSTVAADKMLSATTKKDAKEKRKVVDKIAATYILQTYLDMKVK
jgi:putative Holliday junction resolvase